MTSKPRHKISLDPKVEQILLPFFYFDIFLYPLNLEEIYAFGNHQIASKDIMKSLVKSLVEKGFLYHHQGYYALHDRPDWVDRRLENEKRAQQFFPKARWMSQLMSHFPYVRAVFVSGSLSKNQMPEGGDIDYFIITKPGRLWVARTFLVLFKKIVLLNSHKYFCVNYFIDEEHLEIAEKNRFTATEITTLLPIYGREYYEAFYQANNWIENYYPHAPARALDQVIPFRKKALQKISEFFLNGRIGDWLDQFFMNKTIAYWHKKFKSFDSDAFAVALKSRRYVSKHHPLHFQAKVLREFQKRICTFENNHQLQFSTSFEKKSNDV